VACEASISEVKSSNKKQSPAKTAFAKTSSAVAAPAAAAAAADDDSEIVCLWGQAWGALQMCLFTIGPIFLVIVVACYFVGTLKQSQAIASVGVVYTLLFMSIMGSYALVTIPCILVARLFTNLVSPHAPGYSSAQINLYMRLLILIVAAASAGCYFFLKQ
jgi:hypothetical protein